jgi:hypothetical protein
MDRLHGRALNASFADSYPSFAEFRVISLGLPCKIGSEASVMRSNPFRKLDGFTLVFPILLILAGFLLLAGLGAGVFSLEALERYWPLAIVAAGLVELDPMKPEAK